MFDRFAGGGLYLRDHAPEDAAVILLPIPWEATTSYGRGTALGPAAIHAASVQVDLFDVELADVGVPDPSAHGIVLLAPDPAIEAASREASRCALRVIEAFDDGQPVPRADRDRVNALTRLRDQRVEAIAAQWRSEGRIVGVVGGDHSVPLGAIKAAAAVHPRMGILHIDAHADLRVAYQGFEGSHASIMHNVMDQLDVARLVSVGVRDLCEEEHRAATASKGRIVPFYDVDNARRLHGGESWSSLCDAIVETLPDDVYVSFDIDGLDPTLCPHTGTPVPGGLSFQQAMALLMTVVRANKRIVGFDLCEVAPGPDTRDEWDANVGARVLYKLAGCALASQLSETTAGTPTR